MALHPQAYLIVVAIAEAVGACSAAFDAAAKPQYHGLGNELGHKQRKQPLTHPKEREPCATGNHHQDDGQGNEVKTLA